jgi:signal transduction histidine kinase
MNPAGNEPFSSDLWQQALERFADAAHITVKLFDADEHLVFGPVNPTPLFQLFKEAGYDPGMFADCARRCLAHTESRPTVIVSEFYGLAVIGTSLVQEGKVVGAAVGGYAFVDFSQVSEIQRLASNAGIKFDRMWQVAREQKPVPKQRLILNGELLQVLGDTLLRENFRNRQYEHATRELKEVAEAKEKTRLELEQTATELRETARELKEVAEAKEKTRLELEQTATELRETARELKEVAEAKEKTRLALEQSAGELRETALELEEVAKKKDRLHQEFREQEDTLRKVEKMAAAGRLAAAMAHEINNPLAAVTNVLYLLHTAVGVDESGRMLVDTATKELARVSRIVKQSLSYYRVGVIPRDLDLGGIVNESLHIFSPKILKADIEVKPRIDNGTVMVGFADELRQVIDNLLHNALESMPSGGRLSISVHDSFDWTRNKNRRKGVRLTIADTGCGIPDEILSHVFEPFFTTKLEKGTGLGLWVLQGIVLKHEGVMTLRSSEAAGKSGTTISIFLPAQF